MYLGYTNTRAGSVFFGTFAKLQKIKISFVMSVRLSAWTDWAAVRWILTKFDIWVFFENQSRKFKLY
jgi:hypothetical protein